MYDDIKILKSITMNYLSPQIEAYEKRRNKNRITLVRNDKSCGIFQEYQEYKNEKNSKQA